MPSVGIGALVVVDSTGCVAGILSERDIVCSLAERGSAAVYEPLDHAMTRGVITCTESMTISEVMRRMTADKFRYLPVIELGRLVGIVSIGDVVKYRLTAMQHETGSVRDYILTA